MTILRASLLISTFILCGLILLDYSMPISLSLYVKGMLLLSICLYIAYLFMKFKLKQAK